MDELSTLGLLILSGILIRYSLIFTGQLWAKSHAQTITFMALPIITYVITNTIANNIALSLGMIGALSIVRFRHPVKIALELLIYFALITIGIATSVKIKWAIQLIVAAVLIIFFVKIFQNFLKKYGKTFYSSSFNEGSSTNTIEIVARNKISLVEDSNFLVSSFDNNSEKNIIYRLSFENKDELKNFKNNLNEKDIEKINIIYN